MNRIRSKPSLALALVCFLFFASIAVVRWTPLGEPTPAESPPLSGAEMLTEAPADEAKAGATAQKLANEQPRQPTASSAPERATTADKFREVKWPTFAHPAILERERDGRIYHQVANHLVVTFESPEALSLLEEWVDAESGRSAERLVAETYLVEWGDTSARAYVENKAHLQGLLGDAAVVEPNWIVRTAATQQGSWFWRQRSHYNHIYAEEGWTIRTDARDIVVAVVDSGIDYTHPDLVTRVRPRSGEMADTGRDDDGNGFIDDVYGWDFVENNNNPMDRDGHGTHVAGIIGADGTNTIFGTGVAWDVTLLPVRFLDDEGRGTIANEVKSLDYARVSGAHIVNASYGGAGYSHAVLTQLQALNAAGIWFVTSAGNERVDIDLHPVYPASYDVPNILSVAALRTRDLFPRGADGVLRFSVNLWTSSNFGNDRVDIAAPGFEVYSTNLGERFTSKSGTSMATAFVSGALALLLAEFPEASPAEIRSRLIDRSRFSSVLEGKIKSSGFLDLGRSLAPGPAPAPTVSVSPESSFPVEGASVDLTATFASSRGTVTQWLHNGEPIPDGTGPTLRISAMSTEHEGLYQYRVSDIFGETFSEPASVFLRVRLPVITDHPMSQRSFALGRELHLNVEAESTETISYQWFLNGEPIAGATNPEYLVSKAGIADAGVYHVVLSTSYGQIEPNATTVSILPYHELDWRELAPFAFNIEGRVGHYYLRESESGYLLSDDLLSWSSHPEFVEGLIFSYGEYILITATGSIYRGPDIEELQKWWIGPHASPLTDNSPISFVRNKNTLVAQYPGLGPHYVYNLQTKSFSFGVRPSPRHNDSPISAAKGYFWFLRSPSEIYRSADGINWEVQPDESIFPLWEDEVTGWTVGRTKSSTGSVRIRPPSGDWGMPVFNETSVSISANSLPRPFPGGFTANHLNQLLVFDFHSGVGKKAELTDAVGDLSFNIGMRQIRWADLDYHLYADHAGRYPLVREHNATGDRVLLYTGRSLDPAAWLRYSATDSSFFSLGSTLYRQSRGRIYVYDSNWNLRLVSGDLAGLDRVGETSAEVLFRMGTGESMRLFRLDVDGHFSEVSSSRPAGNFHFVRQGEGYVAVTPNSFDNAGLVTLEDVVAFSSDGASWVDGTGMPNGRGFLIRHREVWIALVRVDEAGGDSGNRIRVYRRLDDGAGWNFTWETPVSGTPTRPVSNGNYILFGMGSTVFRSQNEGAEWEQKEIVIPGRSFSLEPSLNSMGWFFARHFSSNVSLRYASENGFDWFPYQYGDEAPHHVFGNWGISGRAFKFWVTRLEGVTDVRYLDVVVSQTAVPLRRTLQALAMKSWKVERFELFREGVHLATTGGDHPFFQVEEMQSGVFTYSIQAILQDGTRVFSDSLFLTFTPIREEPISRISDEWGVFSSAVRATYYRVGSSFYAHRTSQLPGILRSGDGIDWEINVAAGGFSIFPNHGTPYQKIIELADGSSLFFFNRYRHGGALMGFQSDAGVISDFPKPANSINEFVAPFAIDGHLHALSRDGNLYEFGADNTWHFIRQIDMLLELPGDDTSYTFRLISVCAGDGLYLVYVGGSYIGQDPISFNLLTRDFVELWPVPEVPGYSFEGLWPDKDELVYISDDRRRVIFVDESGEEQPGGITFYLPIEKLSILEEGTLVGETESGVFAFLGSRTGRVWPIPTGVVPRPTYLRDATRLGVFGEKGTYFFLALQDFRVGALGEPEVVYGPLNTLRARVRLNHQGGLSTGADVALSVRAWLEPVSAAGAAIYLGERMVDVSRMQPDNQRVEDLTWGVPVQVEAGDFRLVVRANADDAIASIQTGGRSAESAVFFYHPDPELIVGESAFGRVETEQNGTRFPQGSILRLHAQPDDGFAFMGWEGLPGITATEITLHLDTSYAIRARFLHASLAEAFPDLYAVPGGPWFANETGLFFAAITADWSYHHDLGWFALAESTADGSWLWFPAHGWRFRARTAEFYYDPAVEEWLPPAVAP